MQKYNELIQSTKTFLDEKKAIQTTFIQIAFVGTI